MIKKFITIALLVLVLLVVSTDIIIRFWYEEFDSVKFNNLATPIVTLISLMVFLAALYFPYKQNQIIMSQHLKPDFIDRIKSIKEELRKAEIPFKHNNGLLEPPTEEKCNGLDFPSLVGKSLYDLTNNKAYVKDQRAIQKGEKFDIDYFEQCSYYNYIMFFAHFTSGEFANYFRYNEIKSMIEEIEFSELLPVDKLSLNKYIKTELLANYLGYIKGLNSLTSMPKIPDISTTFSGEVQDVGLAELNKTHFGDFYEYFNTKLS
jgi:hypothetical protein